MKADNKKITVIITGGGTGGHIYPAIAVIQRLKTDSEIEKIYYIGCPFNMEKDIAIAEGVEFLSVSISGMPRKTGISLIKWVFQLFSSVNQALSYFIRIKPDIVFGTGGYVSGPALLAAIILKVPFVIHDSDAHPGIVSKFLAPWAKVVSVAFEQARQHLNSKNIIVNGNPMRANFNNITKNNALSALNLSPDRKTLLVIGGSQGARTINNTMLEIVPELINKYDFQIIHQTGKKNFEEYEKAFVKRWHDFSSLNYMVKPYFDDMATPLAASDIAISRAGSLSISELNLNGLPSILIPYPYAAADHQKFNARAMEKSGAAIMLEDSKCTPDNLIKLILEISLDENKLTNMQQANKQLAKPDSADNLINILKKIAKKTYS